MVELILKNGLNNSKRNNMKQILKAYFVECILFQSDKPIHWFIGGMQWGAFIGCLF